MALPSASGRRVPDWRSRFPGRRAARRRRAESATAFRAQRAACSATKGSFISASDWAGTLVTFRRPIAWKGTGASKASRNPGRKLRRTLTYRLRRPAPSRGPGFGRPRPC
jgi:hypothetical protein